MMYESSIQPLEPALYSELFEGNRKEFIVELSQQLDLIEEQAQGPYLTGPSLSQADAFLFPCFCLLVKTLPEHFGWQEWTTESLFWKRPRLHAWYELMQYEKAALETATRVGSALERFDLTQIEVDAPTLSRRTIPRHAA